MLPPLASSGSTLNRSGRDGDRLRGDASRRGGGGGERATSNRGGRGGSPGPPLQRRLALSERVGSAHTTAGVAEATLLQELALVTLGIDAICNAEMLGESSELCGPLSNWLTLRVRRRLGASFAAAVRHAAMWGLESCTASRTSQCGEASPDAHLPRTAHAQAGRWCARPFRGGSVQRHGSQASCCADVMSEDTRPLYGAAPSHLTPRRANTPQQVNEVWPPASKWERSPPSRRRTGAIVWRDGPARRLSASAMCRA